MSIEDIQAEKEAMEQLGNLIASGDDEAAMAAETRAEREREMVEKHPKPAEGFVKQIRDEREAELDLGDVVAGRKGRDKGPLVGDDGTYKSYEELEKAHRGLQELYGRQSQEVGELRKQAGQASGDETGEYDQDYDEAAFTPDASGFGSLDELEDRIWDVYTGDEDEGVPPNPAAAAAAALQAGHTQLYDEISAEWFEDDPRAASRFEMAAAQQYQQAQYQQQAAQVEASTEKVAEAYSAVQSRHRDFDDPKVQAAMSQAAAENPGLLVGLVSYTPEARERVVESLYRIAKGETAEQALAAQVPHVATGSIIPGGSGRSRSSILNDLEAEADEMNKVNEMFGH